MCAWPPTISTGTSIAANLPKEAINVVREDPRNSNLLFVGTDLAVHVSIDGGKSWMLISQDISGSRSFAGLGFSQIAFSTANPNLAVAGAGSASEGIVRT